MNLLYFWQDLSLKSKGGADFSSLAPPLLFSVTFWYLAHWYQFPNLNYPHRRQHFQLDLLWVLSGHVVEWRHTEEDFYCRYRRHQFFSAEVWTGWATRADPV